MSRARADLSCERGMHAVSADYQSSSHGNWIAFGVDSMDSLDHAFFHYGFCKRRSITNIRSSLPRLVLQKCIQEMPSRAAVNVGCSAAISVKLAKSRFHMSNRDRTFQADSLHIHLQGSEMRRLPENRLGQAPPAEVRHAARPDEMR